MLLAPLAVLVATALCAAPVHAGSFNVFTCSIDGAFYPNRAWTSGNNPAGNPAYQTDTSCPQAGDALIASLAPNTAYGAGTFGALSFNAPSGTRISDFARDEQERQGAGRVSALALGARALLTSAAQAQHL
jgi:hypothetical protein